MTLRFSRPVSYFGMWISFENHKENYDFGGRENADIIFYRRGLPRKSIKSVYVDYNRANAVSPSSRRDFETYSTFVNTVCLGACYFDTISIVANGQQIYTDNHIVGDWKLKSGKRTE